jgi:hypothetical protein
MFMFLWFPANTTIQCPPRRNLCPLFLPRQVAQRPAAAEDFLDMPSLPWRVDFLLEPGICSEGVTSHTPRKDSTCGLQNDYEYL